MQRTHRTLVGGAVLACALAAAGAGLTGQSSLLTQAELRKIGASAATAADHRRLAAHYRAHAREHENDAQIHEEIVTTARRRASDDDAWDLARDAAHYAEHSREAAEALAELATLHEEMAARAR